MVALRLTNSSGFCWCCETFLGVLATSYIFFFRASCNTHAHTKEYGPRAIKVRGTLVHLLGIGVLLSPASYIADVSGCGILKMFDVAVRE